MNWGQIKGDWHQLSRKLKEKWKLLTDTDLESIAGRRDQLEDVLSDRYGYGKTQATIELDKFTDAIPS
jgi:uncharacterized protein YjbJ (UPF0337 family)